MGKLLVLVTAGILLCAACNCGAPQAPKTVDRSFKAPPSLHFTEADKRRDHNKELMSHIKERTVHVSRDCTVKKGAVVLGSSNPNRAFDGRGTGVIVQSGESKSYIFTAAHVVVISSAYSEGFTCSIKVRLNKHSNDRTKSMDANILVFDDDRDIAVLVVNKNLGVSSELEPEPFTGEDVWAAGFPRDFMNPAYQEISITKGTLASVLVPTRGGHGHYHRVTSQVYYGNSGGGIWNKEGKIVGIVSAMFTDNEDNPYEGYYYVKPVQEFQSLLKKKWKYWEIFGK